MSLKAKILELHPDFNGGDTSRVEEFTALMAEQRREARRKCRCGREGCLLLDHHLKAGNVHASHACAIFCRFYRNKLSRAKGNKIAVRKTMPFLDLKLLLSNFYLLKYAALFFALCLTGCASASDVNVTWNYPTWNGTDINTNVQGYVVFYATGGTISSQVITGQSNTNLVVSNASEGESFWVYSTNFDDALISTASNTNYFIQRIVVNSTAQTLIIGGQ